MENLNHFGLANALHVSSQMLRDKIIFHKRTELEKLGKIVDNPNGIELNVDQILFLTVTLSTDPMNKIRLIKGVCNCLEMVMPENVSFEQVQIQKPIPYSALNPKLQKILEGIEDNLSSTEQNPHVNKYGI